MQYALLRTSALALAFAASAGLAAAQQQPPPADAQQQSQQEKAQQTPSGQMGKEEPSSHAPSAAPPANAVFVNGALAVPGAPACRKPATIATRWGTAACCWWVRAGS